MQSKFAISQRKLKFQKKEIIMKIGLCWGVVQLEERERDAAECRMRSFEVFREHDTKRKLDEERQKKKKKRNNKREMKMPERNAVLCVYADCVRCKRKSEKKEKNRGSFIAS